VRPVIAREAVLSDVIGILEDLMGDWEFGADIREDSYMWKDLGLESIDAVALGSGINERYQRTLPFAQFLYELSQQEEKDFTVGQLVDFVTRALNAGATEVAR
jgi:acyl carrier protein